MSYTLANLTISSTGWMVNSFFCDDSNRKKNYNLQRIIAVLKPSVFRPYRLKYQLESSLKLTGFVMKKMYLRQILSFAAFMLIIINAGIGSEKRDKTTRHLVPDQLKLLAASYEKAKSMSGRTDVVTVRSMNSDGTLSLIPSKDWCSGFFAGSLWLGSVLTGDKELKRLAAEYTLPLEQEKFNGRTHDMGFKIMCSFGQGYKITRDPLYRDILIESAKTLATRFSKKAGVIRSWDHNKDKWRYPVIIDNMMNLELLFRASQLTGDQEYYNIAVKHADITLANHFRADNSSFHVVDYDTISGSVLKKTTHQGYSDASAWARGQAWGLYGYTMCYRETKLVRYLDQAEKIAGFIMNHPNLPSDKIPCWDFDAPDRDQAPRDVSAAAVTASALIELARFVPSKKDLYQGWAALILENLKRVYLSKPGENNGFLLGHSTGSMPQKTEVDVPIIYAEYYFLEALVRQRESRD
jgi:hypothetical protein